jgi:4-diphosphocytidyl-2-C-methyl-D-erythritol kinase
MIDFPNAKINLGLRVLDKRPDGYHNISTVMYPVKELADVLEIIEAPGPVFECTGPYSQGLAGDNLCTRAYALLKQDFDIPPVHMYLYKNIPVGAGLGGGSADAAFALKMINVIFSLNLTDEKLEAYAARLGSDCPFFIRNVPAHAAGRGEIGLCKDSKSTTLILSSPYPSCSGPGSKIGWVDPPP